jgi:hypothetical protein
LQHATLPLYATAFVTVPATIASLPKQIENSEGTWNVLAFIGEKRLANPGGLVLVAAGPQGPKGDAGENAPLSTVVASLSADHTLLSAGGSDAIMSLSLTAGKWLVFADVQLQCGGTAGIANLWLVEQGAGGAGNLFAASQQCNTANGWFRAHLFGVVSPAVPRTYEIWGGGTVANIVARKNNQSSDLATHMGAVQIGV